MRLPAARAPGRLAATAQTRTQSRADLGSPPRSQARLSSPESCGDPGLPGTGAGRSRIPSEGEIPEFPPAAPILPQVSAARRGPGQPGSVLASPFSSDAFDPRALRRTSARELPGSARGDPGNRPRFISFHQAALGSLETAEPVIAFFRGPGADWITANQRLVYT